MRRILCLVLAFQTAVCGADFSPPPAYDVVLKKPATDVHPDFVKSFTKNYNRGTIDLIGRDNIVENEKLQASVGRLHQAYPKLTKMPAKILENFLLRTELVMKLIRNGYVHAAGQELEFFIADAGELESAIGTVYSEKINTEITVELMGKCFELSLEADTYLRQAERDRIVAALNEAQKILGDKKELRRIAKAERKELLQRNLEHSITYVGGALITLFAYLYASDVANRMGYLDGRAQDTLSFGAFYSWGGVEFALFINYFRTRIRLLKPWSVGKMADLRNSCTRVLMRMREEQ